MYTLPSESLALRVRLGVETLLVLFPANSCMAVPVKTSATLASSTLDDIVLDICCFRVRCKGHQKTDVIGLIYLALKKRKRNWFPRDYCSGSQNLPGREAELANLEQFICENLENETSASLYVSGPPGTGRTACLSKIMQQPEVYSKLKVVYVNCAPMKLAPTIYAEIIQQLEIGDQKGAKNSKDRIEKYLVTNHEMLLFVLDEIDQLKGKTQAILYSLFEWPSKPHSKLISVSIASALDLTDSILPLLQARCEMKPKVMSFAPYSKQQIYNTASSRLDEANVADALTGTAMQLPAGKRTNSDSTPRRTRKASDSECKVHI